MAFDVQNGVTGAVNGILPEEKPTKTPATKPANTDEEGAE